MTLHRTIRDAVRATFEAGWPHAIPVLWRVNEQPQIPDAGVTPHWLEIAVDFGTDEIMAYGGGRLANDRRQFGSAAIRVFTATGYGEDQALDYLSDAVAALRSQRSGPLSFVGSISGLDDGGTEDGAWWLRGAVVAFEYRFTG